MNKFLVIFNLNYITISEEDKKILIFILKKVNKI